MYYSLREKCPYSEFFWSECRKIRTRKTPNRDTFHAVIGWIIVRECVGEYADQN